MADDPVPADRCGLVGDEPRGDFCTSPGRHNRLAAFALITTRKAIDFHSGAAGGSFGGGEAFFAKQLRHAEKFLIFALAAGEAG